jgi:FkbM family methyltransferase
MKFIFLIYYKFIESFFHLPRIKKFIKKNLKFKKPLIFDVGAYEGSTLKLFYEIYSQGKFCCFEPNKTKYDQLKKIKIKQMQVFNTALGSVNKNASMRINPIDMTNSISKLKKNSFYLKIKNFIIRKNIYKIILEKIEMIKLDTFCLKKKINKINILKIDTEGYEFNVLKGGKKILKNVDFIIIELQNNDMYEGYSRKKIENFLKNNNFKKIKSFQFPLMFFEDCIYQNLRFKSFKNFN